MDTLSNRNVLSLNSYDVQCIGQAHDLLCKKCEQQLTIEYLALEVGINRNKLAYGFKQLYGNTIHNFQQQQRLQKALSLLTTTYKPIKTITAMTGYCSSSRLAAVFKKMYGATPLQYRKKMREMKEEPDMLTFSNKPHDQQPSKNGKSAAAASL